MMTYNGSISNEYNTKGSEKYYNFEVMGIKEKTNV
jgi:hypothetical protein